MLSREYLYRSIFICIMKNKYIIYVYIYDMHAKDSQKIKKKTKIPRVTNEGWNSQKQLSGPVEQKKKEKTPVSSSKAFPWNVSYLSAERLFPVRGSSLSLSAERLCCTQGLYWHTIGRNQRESILYTYTYVHTRGARLSPHLHTIPRNPLRNLWIFFDDSAEEPRITYAADPWIL